MDGAHNSGVDVVLGVGDHGGSLGVLHDGLALDGHGVGDVVGGVHMDGGGDLDDVLLVDGDIIGDLDLLLDDGGVVGDGAPEDGGHGDGEVGGGGLQDPGGVPGDEAGLSVVNLLGDHGGGLVHGGHALGLGGGDIGGGGGWGHIVDRVGDHW